MSERIRGGRSIDFCAGIRVGTIVYSNEFLARVINHDPEVFEENCSRQCRRADANSLTEHGKESATTTTRSSIPARPTWNDSKVPAVT